MAVDSIEGKNAFRNSLSGGMVLDSLLSGRTNLDGNWTLGWYGCSDSGLLPTLAELSFFV